MRIPYSIQGLLVAVVVISLEVLFKGLCSAAGPCFADYFADSIFMPLIVVYRIFGSSAVIFHQEFLFVFLYWALVGFLLGLILDLCIGRFRYSHEPHLPPS